MSTSIIRGEKINILLISSASKNIYPNNCNNSFINQFSNQLVFEGNYEVSLQAIHYKAIHTDKACGPPLQPAILSSGDNGLPKLLCVYINIIQPVIVAGNHVPLLAVIPQNSDDSYESQEQLRHRLIVHRFNEINVQLTDGNGCAYQTEGATAICLSFTRV